MPGDVTRVIRVDWADSALKHKQLVLKAAVPVIRRHVSQMAPEFPRTSAEPQLSNTVLREVGGGETRTQGPD